MVEINNQRKAFLDMLAWSEGTDNGRQKPEIWLWRHCGKTESLCRLLRSPSQTCIAKPKTQINRRRTLPASFPLVGCLPQSSLAWKTSLRKVRTLWHCSRLRSVALYLWLIVVISVRQSMTVQQYLEAQGAGYGQFGMSWPMIAGTKREDSQGDVWQSHPLIIALDYLHHRLPVMGCLIITVITPLPTKPSATQKYQRTEAGERSNYWRTDASAWCLLARCKIPERGASVLSWKWCSAWWCCRWSSSVAHQSSLSVSAYWSHHRLRRGCAASPRLADTARQDYFTLRERLITVKTTGRTRSILMSSADRVAHIDGQLIPIIVSNTHALPAGINTLK